MEQVILKRFWTENNCKFLSQGIFRGCLEEGILTEYLARVDIHRLFNKGYNYKVFGTGGTYRLFGTGNN